MRLVRVSALFLSLICWTAMSNNAHPEPKSAGERLHAIFDAEWEGAMEQHPTWASQMGGLPSPLSLAPYGANQCDGLNLRPPGRIGREFPPPPQAAPAGAIRRRCGLAR